MTGRTHDLAAFTALSFIAFTEPIHRMSLATALVAFSANMIGGIAPDIDQPTAAIWHRIPVGSLFGKIVQPLLGGHRYISHSIVGIFLFGAFTKFILEETKTVLIVDRDVVWWAFMIGFLSHLVMDTLTHDGVPWLFPIPFRFGIPPLRFLRPKTGGVVEKSFIFPMLLIANVVIYYTNYHKVLDFLRHYLVK